MHAERAEAGEGLAAIDKMRQRGLQPGVIIYVGAISSFGWGMMPRVPCSSLGDATAVTRSNEVNQSSVQSVRQLAVGSRKQRQTRPAAGHSKRRGKGKEVKKKLRRR